MCFASRPAEFYTLQLTKGKQLVFPNHAAKEPTSLALPAAGVGVSPQTFSALWRHDWAALDKTAENGALNGASRSDKLLFGLGLTRVLIESWHKHKPLLSLPLPDKQGWVRVLSFKDPAAWCFSPSPGRSTRHP